MRSLIKNIATGVVFLSMALMHVYFVLLLLAKPALAAQMASPAQQEVDVVEKTVEASDSDINIKMDLKDGITVKGLKGALKQLKHMDANSENGKVEITEDGIKFTKSTEGDNSDTVSISTPHMASTISDILEDVVVPVVLFLCIFGFAAYAVHAKQRTRREYLETIKALAQSGQPIPPELMNSMNAGIGSGKLLAPGKGNYDSNALQGVRYIFYGIGISGMMILLSKGEIAYAIGFFFIVMGAFHIYTSQLEQKQKPIETPATPTATTTTPQL